MSTLAMKPPPERKGRVPSAWIFSLGLLAAMYSLLFLSMTEHFGHNELMSRCVLMNGKLSRVWSVANVEVGVAYFGVFAAMTFYLVSIRRAAKQHLDDLALAFAYLICSFLLDYVCVQTFSPFVALLIGDAVVMTFTLLVSRELWFQRLLGVFVPLIFFTCGLVHLLEGLSYWRVTYPLNVPWCMVTADIGFAVLVNSARFPALIRGADVHEDLERARAGAAAQHALFRDVLFSVTDGKLRFHLSAEGLPPHLPERGRMSGLGLHNLSAAREMVGQIAEAMKYTQERADMLITAVGEALMNAIVHGRNGDMSVRAASRQIQVWIQDEGSGIPLQDLPNATLQKGWSSRGTMGMGFPLMLSTSDAVDIVTSSAGTTVVITMNADQDDGLRLPFLQGIDPRPA